MRAIFLLFEFLGFTLLLSILLSQSSFSLLAKLVGGRGYLLGPFAWLCSGFVILLFAWLLNRIRRGRGLKELGFHLHKGFLADVWYRVLGYGLIYILSLPIDLVALSPRAKMAGELIAQLGLSSSLTRVLLLGGLVVLGMGFFTGAFPEEIRFRGYYQGVGSMELSPLAGFVIAFIPFSFGHYFSHPEWHISQVVATIIPGIGLSLLYNATGSLVVVMTTHTLLNWISFYPPLVYAVTKNKALSLSLIFVFALFFIFLIAIRWQKEVRELFSATSKMFSQKPVISTLLGLGIGGALLSLGSLSIPHLYSALLGASLLGISFIKRRR